MSAEIANVGLRTETRHPPTFVELGLDGRRTMMLSKIGEKFIGPYLGAGTLSSAVRSADAKC
jgi:hypothetical protein